MVAVRITVNGTDDDEDDLADWLGNESGLRGRWRRETTPPVDGTMGAVTVLVVQLAAIGGVSTVLAGSLRTWFGQRRSKVSLTLTGPAGRPEPVDRSNVEQLGPILARLVEAAEPAPD